MAVMASSRPLLRWALPAAVTVAVVGGGAATAVIRASADAGLPPRSAAQLLVDVQTADMSALSGTVVEHADLGLPSLPTGGNGSSGFDSLITGSHTLRVWYSGPDKARIALLDTLGESDLIRSGGDVWMWSSRDNAATHSTHDEHAAPNPTRPPLTPQQAADQALAALDPSTVVSTGTSARVAGRAAYELVLAPRDTSSSLLSQVRIAIDGQRHVPLRVQVYAKGGASPVGEIGFTQVSFARPDDAQFRFTPPPGATVTERGSGTPDHTGQAPAQEPVLIGTGWTTVAVAHLPAAALATPGPAQRGGQNPLDQVLNSLPRVSGAWGSGRLLTSKAFSALLTDDGRVLVGAVTPDRLYSAAADPRAK